LGGECNWLDGPPSLLLVWQFYMAGVELENAVYEGRLDGGVWRRCLHLRGQEEDALILAQRNKNWPTIASFLRYYISASPHSSHWSTRVAKADGSIHVCFQDLSGPASAPRTSSSTNHQSAAACASSASPYVFIVSAPTDCTGSTTRGDSALECEEEEEEEGEQAAFQMYRSSAGPSIIRTVSGWTTKAMLLHSAWEGMRRGASVR
jgi:hypothetical protein